MKTLSCSLLFCLISLSASSQKYLNGDSLASDFRYLIRQLEATHPDPYSGFGGKVFFHEQAFLLEQELHRTPLMQDAFHSKVNVFLSALQDGHTYLFMPASHQPVQPRSLPLKIRTIPEGILLQSLPEAYKSLLGSRITAIHHTPVEEVLARTATLHACENLYGRYANLSRFISTESFLKQLFPEITDTVSLSLLTPHGQTCDISLPLLAQQEAANTPMQHTDACPAYTGQQLNYRFADNQKQVMLIRIHSIMARDNFEYMQKQGWKDLHRQIAYYYREVLKQEMPADTLQAIRQLPSFSETFGNLLKEMKKERAETLIIDLRDNNGGWTPIVLPTLYQLFGDRYLEKDMSMKFYRLVSPLYMQKLQTTLPDFNQRHGTHYTFGDYTFGTTLPDTTGIEQKRAAFIRNAMSSVPEELQKQQGRPLYTPKHIYVITNEQTFSAAFHYAFYLWKMGATLIGVPSRQAPNTYMEQTLFHLPYTGMQGSISNSMQICFPAKDQQVKTLYPDLMLTYQEYRKYNFDVHTEILYLLEKHTAKGSRPQQ